MKKLFIICLSMIFFMGIMPDSTAYASDWRHVTRGTELFNQGKYEEAAKEFERAAAISEKASTLRKLAETYVKLGQMQKAADTYYREAAVHKKLGATNTYLAVLNLANALNTELDIYYQTNQVTQSTNLAKYEPANGMYIGAYIEDEKTKFSGVANKYKSFNELTGKNHAIFFTYHNYGQPFPSHFAKTVKEVGGAIHLALEPKSGLQAVTDNAYLRQFAKDAKDSGVPVFLRFASEMNGAWVNWSKDPALYKQKFQLVSKVMKEEAPNVAMAWVPNSVPVHNIDDYYPGDQWVDWVGVNLYSVPYFNGDIKQPAQHVNPLDLVDPIYAKYANRKPIMIGEFGASHFSSVGNQDMTKFGTTKMAMFYQGLKMKYPRVKSLHWFSVDTLTSAYVNPERRLNNFSLTANTKFLDSYKSVIRDPYFLSTVVNGPLVSQQTKEVPTVEKLNLATMVGDVQGLSFAKTYDPYISKIVFRLNGQYLTERTQYPFDFTISQSQLKVGKNELTAVLFDSKNKEAGRKTVTFTHRKAFTLQNNEIMLFINERSVYNGQQQLQLLAAPFVSNDRTLVPLRFISESLGSGVEWDKTNKRVTITNKDKKIILHEGSRSILVNGTRYEIETGAQIRNNTTFVPVRFISEHLGATVQYNKQDQSIKITK